MYTHTSDPPSLRLAMPHVVQYQTVIRHSCRYISVQSHRCISFCFCTHTLKFFPLCRLISSRAEHPSYPTTKFTAALHPIHLQTRCKHASKQGRKHERRSTEVHIYTYPGAARGGARDGACQEPDAHHDLAPCRSKTNFQVPYSLETQNHSSPYAP